jgi:hypothetical protein
LQHELTYTPGTNDLHAKPYLWDSMSPGTLFDTLISPVSVQEGQTGAICSLHFLKDSKPQMPSQNILPQ